MERNKPENIFNISLIFIAAIAVFIAETTFGDRARIFPAAFSWIILIMVSLYVIVSNLKNPPNFLRFILRSGALSNLGGLGMAEAAEAEDTTEKKEVVEKAEDKGLPWGQVYLIFACLTAYVLSMYIIHYLLATLIFLILFLRFMGKVRWKTLLLFACILTGSLYILFEMLLGVSSY